VPDRSSRATDFPDFPEVFCKADSSITCDSHSHTVNNTFWHIFLVLPLGLTLSSPLWFLYQIFPPLTLHYSLSPISPLKMPWLAVSTEPLSWASSGTLRAHNTDIPLDSLVHQRNQTMNLHSNNPPSTSHAVCTSLWISRRQRILMYADDGYRCRWWPWRLKRLWSGTEAYQLITGMRSP